jgi:hypothetical protein
METLKRYKKFVSVNESIEEFGDSLIEFVKDYLEEKWTKKEMNDFLDDNIHKYVDEDELTYYSSLSNSDIYEYNSKGLLEYDLLYKMEKDILKEFDLTPEQYKSLKLNQISENHMTKTITWYDKFLFGPNQGGFRRRK